MPLGEPVPGNRWDLLSATATPPEVSVVVVHYNQPEQLARTYRALTRQTVPLAEVVVADDGSSELPTVRPGGPPTRVVSQPDLGFRAGAARNLGADHCRGEILVFLDADTTPEPDFVRNLTRRVAASRDVVAVGRRRHADMGGLPLGADPATAPELDEPAWLRDGYTASRDLLDADGRSFRYVISSVLSCRRSLYNELGGFDERFVDYGGEDWDFAYRAWNAGALLVHEPTAVAWHDGPDWAGRYGPNASHDRQSLRLAELIPEPATRGAPLPGSLPDVLVDIEAGLDQGSVVRCVHSLLRQSFRDLRARLPWPVDPALRQIYGCTTQSAPWNPDQLRRARARLAVRAPLPADAVCTAMRELVGRDLGIVEILTSGTAAATLTSTRAASRAQRWADHLPERQAIAELFGIGSIDAGPAPLPRSDIAGFFAGGWEAPGEQ